MSRIAALIEKWDSKPKSDNIPYTRGELEEWRQSLHGRRGQLIPVQVPQDIGDDVARFKGRWDSSPMTVEEKLFYGERVNPEPRALRNYPVHQFRPMKTYLLAR